MFAPDFSDRVAIVTGAGKGIGQATSMAFARLGARVVLSGQSEEPLLQTLALIEQTGGRSAIVVGDVSQESAAQETVATALKSLDGWTVRSTTPACRPGLATPSIARSRPGSG